MKKYEVANSLKSFLGKENNKILLKYSLEEKLSDEEKTELEKIYLENLQKQRKRIANKIKLEKARDWNDIVPISGLLEGGEIIEWRLQGSLGLPLPVLGHHLLHLQKVSPRQFPPHG